MENRSNIQTVSGSDTSNRLTFSNHLTGLLARDVQSAVTMLAAIGVSFALYPAVIEFPVYDFEKASNPSEPARAGPSTNAAPIRKLMQPAHRYRKHETREPF